MMLHNLFVLHTLLTVAVIIALIICKTQIGIKSFILQTKHYIFLWTAPSLEVWSMAEMH